MYRFGKQFLLLLLLLPACPAAFGFRQEIKRDVSAVTPLIAAVNANNVPLMQQLLSRGADSNARDIKGNTSLYYAVDAGNVEAVELLLDNGAHIDKQNGVGVTPLIRAIQKDDQVMATLLIKRGADANAADAYKSTPLMWAAEKNFIPIVQLLLAHGADVNVRNNAELTALMFAIYSTPETRSLARETARILVAAGADVNVVSLGWDTPLLHAIDAGDEKMVEFLMSKGARVNSPAGIISPLMYAMLKASGAESLAIINLLLAHGADVNAQDEDGDTPLMYAIKYWGNGDPNKILKIIQLLCAYGADVAIQNTQGQTARDVAQQSGSSEEIITLLTPSAD